MSKLDMTETVSRYSLAGNQLEKKLFSGQTNTRVVTVLCQIVE